MTDPSRWTDEIHIGDCRTLMKQMAVDGVRVNCIVTSPPYWGLRDYGIAGQFGLERTWVRHVARMRGTFRAAGELLADDGTLWMNYGDSYAGSGGQSPQSGPLFKGRARQRENICMSLRNRGNGLKNKDLVGMPWRIAFALQSDGWYLRSDIIWHKPNPMPESVLDRPTKSHEYIFMLSKSDRYFYDRESTLEQTSTNTRPRRALASRAPGAMFTDEQAPSPPRPDPQSGRKPAGWASGTASHSTLDHNRPGPKDEQRQAQGLRDSTKFGRGAGHRKLAEHSSGIKNNASFQDATPDVVETRNMRSVWSLVTEGFGESHFATFPRELVRRCILAGSRPGDIVFDPFMGSGTVAEVALSLGRRFIGCELNPEYAAMFRAHRSQQTGLAL